MWYTIDWIVGQIESLHPYCILVFFCVKHVCECQKNLGIIALWHYTRLSLRQLKGFSSSLIVYWQISKWISEFFCCCFVIHKSYSEWHKTVTQNLRWTELLGMWRKDTHKCVNQKTQTVYRSKQFSINSVDHPAEDGAWWAFNFKPLGLTGHQFK